MIEIHDDLFLLSTDHTSILIGITPHGHPEWIHYGARVSADDAGALRCRRTAAPGCAVNYAPDDPNYSLQSVPLAWSGPGRGDFRESPLEWETSAGSAADLRFVSAAVTEGSPSALPYPQARGAEQTLHLTLADEAAQAELTLLFTVFPQEDVIVRRSILKNTGTEPIIIKKLMSSMLDLAGRYEMTSFHGAWIAEARRETVPVGYTRCVNESVTGFSSNRHNPGFLLSEPGAGQSHGRVYGFNLIWSGDHYASAQRSHEGLTRVMQGVSPADFSRTLQPGGSFSAPEAFMSFSPNGFNGLSAHMHDFINRRIVPARWQGCERPVLYNSWEGCGFDFTERRLLDLGRRAARLGCELFVLDDGWFGARDSDSAGLGDYTVNRKLPDGLAGLAGKLKKLGLSFGLWFEPEAVNPDSDLCRAHPDWALTEPGREPVLGRNELLLDLTRPEVRDYIVESVGRVLDSADISYVKWDMNRHSTAVGEKAFDYILGLYDVLRRIFESRPEILLESCASGGNRFDAGMLCFGPQIWASDNTDPVDRLDIQDGLSYLYPLSVMGAHVSAAPHAQTLRHTPLSTRGNVSFFGVLGYELDLKYLTSVDEKDITSQIRFYKQHRQLFQFGRFSRLPAPDDEVRWQVSLGDTAAAGMFYRLVHAAPAFDELRLLDLDPDARYLITSRGQNLRVGDFGSLLRHVVPVRLNPRGLVVSGADALYVMPECAESEEASGAALMSGIRLSDRFCGTGYNDEMRLVRDFSSRVYLIRREAQAET